MASAANTRKTCNCGGQCSGYGTQATCPPLIVVAVMEACGGPAKIAKAATGAKQ